MKHVLVAQGRIDTPLGPLTLATTARGLALAWFDGQAHRTDEVDAPLQPGNDVLRQAEREFDEYFTGRRRAFGVPLDPAGTDFQQRVWQALLKIPMGRLSSYGDIARELGLPAAARAVGAAVGRNPIAIIVPCHRVVGSDGSLTGYAAGLPRKQALLLHEAAAPFTDLGAPA
ncbi:MAG: methylated-DNA--[protein]-cysteine S-methyltransferase [Burkholderiaceae bacterium]|nr:methylated-DNA--[protein]-cysteine S-methyltransferase [Burkholderiaceae bacterium]